MAIKSKERAWGCFSKAAEDEPLFVLRATDKVAPQTVRAWVSLASHAGVKGTKLDGALELAREMEKWQVEHGSKVPD